MSLADFLGKSCRRLANRGTDALGPIAADFFTSALTRVYRELDPDLGYRVYDREWDVLLVLDAARADLYFEVAGRGRAALSCASSSREWMAKNFASRYRSETERTAYVTANPFSADLDSAEFALLDEVWRSDWDDDLGTVPPGPVTDHALAATRSNEYDRVIVHYMQPHVPFIGATTRFGRMSRETFGSGEQAESVWPRVALGDLDSEPVIDAYRENHRYIYEHIQRVLENVEGTVAITADHANALGEWGAWGHRQYLPVPALKTVPWDVRACSDERTDEPGPVTPTTRENARDRNGTNNGDRAVAERLQRLGYRE